MKTVNQICYCTSCQEEIKLPELHKISGTCDLCAATGPVNHFHTGTNDEAFDYDKPVFVIGLNEDDECPSFYTVVLTKEDAEAECKEYNCDYAVRKNSEFEVDVFHYFPISSVERGHHSDWEAAFKAHLESGQFEKVSWSTGERDSFGPVTRVIFGLHNGYRFSGLF